mmetsp:Transcript_47229/g.60693  ORF Transcript_47229/g.60693 Transcript_47229/m.60693 type:complete len:252 (-) Transcript_47229:88-843(-)
MILFPPAHTPLRAQSQDIRKLLLDNSERTIHNKKLFQKKPFCKKGHPLSKQPSPHRICCCHCKKNLKSHAYCCTYCQDNNWMCGDCIVFIEHQVQDIGNDRRLEISDKNKLIYKKKDLKERRENFQNELKSTKGKLNMLIDGPQNRCVSNLESYSRVPFTRPRPRIHFSSTPHSFFTPVSTEQALDLRLHPPSPLKSRQESIQKQAVNMNTLSETVFSKREQLHQNALEEFGRRTLSRGALHTPKLEALEN